jgi:hypothetical protein
VRARRATFALCVLLFAGCGGDAAADGDPVVKFGANCYRIPAWNAALMNGAVFFPFSESRKENSLRLKFSNADIAARLPGYVVPLMTTGAPLRASLVSLWIPPAEELAKMHANRKSMNQDILYGLGEYSSRVVEPSSATGLYRVWPLAGGYSWWIVSKMPDSVRRDTHLAEGFWVGGCLRYDDVRKPSCDATLERDGMIIEVSMNEEFLLHREELGRYVAETLDGWKVPCGS